MNIYVSHSSKDNSPHVLREIERAVSKHIAIMVYKLEEVELTKSLEYFLMTHQWVSAKPGVEDYHWWLRDAAGSNHYRVYVVCNSYSGERLAAQSAGLEGFGILPAMAVDVISKSIVVK